MLIDQHYLADDIVTPAPIDDETSTDRDRDQDAEPEVDDSVSMLYRES